MKFNQYARIATVPLALLQGYAMLVLFQRQGVIGFDSPLQMIASLLTITAGSMLLMWMGELITEKGLVMGCRCSSSPVLLRTSRKYPANGLELYRCFADSRLRGILSDVNSDDRGGGSDQ